MQNNKTKKKKKKYLIPAIFFPLSLLSSPSATDACTHENNIVRYKYRTWIQTKRKVNTHKLILVQTL